VVDESFDRKTFLPGTEIFREGQAGDHAYLIEEGRVEITALRQGKPLVIANLGPGDLFGEMAMIDDQVRSATATAIEETEVLSISRDQLQKKLEKADPVLGMLIRVVLKRFRWGLQRLLADESPSRARNIYAGTDRDGVLRNAREHAIKQIRLVQELEHALKHDELELHYQPILDCRTGVTAGFEALVRWQHPDRGLLYPLKFIGAAEETGLIVPMGLWALEQACLDLLRFQQYVRERFPERRPLFMTVNLSASQLERPRDVRALTEVLTRVGLTPGSVKLEITESLLIQNPDLSAQVLGELKELGVGIAIDDFGTGYSSLSYLHRFPVDTLKIDQSFVHTMLENNDSLHVVRAIVGLAHELGLDIVAEGVSNDEQYQLLYDLRCQYIQGYLASKPLSVTQALDFL